VRPRKEVITQIQREVFGGGRVDLIPELYVPAMVDTILRAVTTIRTAFPDLTVTVDHLIAEEHEVACRWTATGTQREWFQNVPPTNARVSWSGISMYAFEPDSDRVRAVLSNQDVYGLLNQLRVALK